MFKTKEVEVALIIRKSTAGLYASMIDDEDNDSWSSLCWSPSTPLGKNWVEVLTDD